jgi:hypothetical protein
VSKILKPGRTSVELRPSRIRREPPAPAVRKELNPVPTEREAWVVAIGVVAFALALAIIIVGFSDFLFD